MGIYWLASYPKSGNTWFRLILHGVRASPEDVLDINQINTGSIASSRFWLESVLGVDTSYFSSQELDALKPAIYRWHAEAQESLSYHKIHDAYTYLPNGDPMIPVSGCLGALYFIRNPLDVAISFANHSQVSIDQSIDMMARENAALARSKHRYQAQARQKLLSWSSHVKSWLDADIHCLVIRYEDMIMRPQQVFRRALSFLQLDPSDDLLATVIEKTAFDNIQRIEREQGFREKPQFVKQFFRKGVMGDWQATLSQSQIDRIISSHGEIMQKFGYLDSAGNPLVGNELTVST